VSIEEVDRRIGEISAAADYEGFAAPLIWKNTVESQGFCVLPKR